jgi:DNA-binding NarL/FixJ family response regulator
MSNLVYAIFRENSQIYCCWILTYRTKVASIYAKKSKKNIRPIHILGLSSFNQQSYIQKMMDNGASGYVLKNATRSELMEAIETSLPME